MRRIVNIFDEFESLVSLFGRQSGSCDFQLARLEQSHFVLPRFPGMNILRIILAKLCKFSVQPSPFRTTLL